MNKDVGPIHMGAYMTTSRLEAFSDRVIAIIITIMVLEMKMPPAFLSYVLSFVYVGITGIATITCYISARR